MQQICFGLEDATDGHRSVRHERRDAVVALSQAGEIVNAMQDTTLRAELIDQFELDAGWTEQIWRLDQFLHAVHRRVGRQPATEHEQMSIAVRELPQWRVRTNRRVIEMMIAEQLFRGGADGADRVCGMQAAQ